MSFIDLKNINFVKTNIEVTPEITYISGSANCENLLDLGISQPGIVGVVNDYNNFSKSVLNPELLTDLVDDIDTSNLSNQQANNIADYKSYLEKLLFDSDENHENNNFMHSTEEEGFFYVSDKLKSTTFSYESNDIDGFNSSLKNYNSNTFLNQFKVNRIESKFSYDDYFLRKNNIIKDNLYKYYSHNKDIEHLRNINFGFYNYNTINLFSQFYDQNKTHSNALVYSNLKTSIVSKQNVYDFINKDNFNISFYLNKRKEAGLNNHGCIIHIPGLISVYISNGTNRNIRNDIKSFKLGFTVGTSSFNNINEANSNVVYSSDNLFDADYWTHISLNVNIINSNKVVIKILLNGQEKENITIDNVSFESIESPFNSYIVIGNKPYYSNKNINDINTFYLQCFAQYKSQTNDVDGPYFEKSIELGTKGLYEISGNVLDDIQEANRILFKEDNLSESLESEIHDIRIFENSLTEYDVSSIFEKGISNITLHDSLSFYLPVYFIPKSIRKKALFNAGSDLRHLMHNSVYNPFFANFCGGYEVSIENFLYEFVNKSTPNIIIGGSNFNNIIGETLNDSVNSLITTNDFTNKIKKGVNCNKIYLDNLINETAGSNTVTNLNYINNLILPNDNGLQNQYHEVIKNTFSFSSEELEFFKKEDSFELNSFVSQDKKILNNQSFQYSIEESYKESTKNNTSIYINSDGDIIDNNDTIDNLYSIDNILYHIEYSQNTFTSNNVENSINTFNGSFRAFSILRDYKLNDLDDIYSITRSNVLIKDYKNPTLDNDEINLFTEQVSDKEELYGSAPLSSQVYNSFILPYRDFNNNLYSFSNIIELSSQIYNKKIQKDTFNILDVDLLGSNGKISMKIKDNGYGTLYRADCKSTQASWNYLGHLFYNEGIIVLQHPGIENFGYNSFRIDFRSENKMFVNEINIPCESGLINKSINSSYNSDLRSSSSAFDQDEEFVYITDINLHDENLNIIAKAKLAQPIPKKNTDNILFRLKMDY